MWEKKNEELKKERGILPQITNPVSTAVSQWRDAGYPSQKSSKKTANTHSQYARTMRRYLEACGDHDIDDYSWENAKIFQDYLEDDLGLGDGTVNKEQRHLQVFISWCYNTQKNETAGGPAQGVGIREGGQGMDQKRDPDLQTGH